MCHGSEKDGKCVVLQRETGRRYTRGALRVGTQKLEHHPRDRMFIRQPNSLRLPLRHLSLIPNYRTAEQHVYTGSCLPTFENLPPHLRFYCSERQSGRPALVSRVRQPSRPFVSASKVPLSTRPFLRLKVLLTGGGYSPPPSDGTRSGGCTETLLLPSRL
jgi:hypothetical protein